jgi:hypothetical protein
MGHHPIIIIWVCKFSFKIFYIIYLIEGGGGGGGNNSGYGKYSSNHQQPNYPQQQQQQYYNSQQQWNNNGPQSWDTYSPYDNEKMNSFLSFFHIGLRVAVGITIIIIIITDQIQINILANNNPIRILPVLVYNVFRTKECIFKFLF